MLREGENAPGFSLLGSDGKKHRLDEFKGKVLVLYFYPKDDTPGCTSEAKCLNSSIGEIRKRGAEVVGVSADSIESHKKFAFKHGLDFLLLSDPEKEVIKEYDAYGNRGIFGEGTLRKTFVIDRKGRVIKVFEKVNAGNHDKEVLDFLDAERKNLAE